MKRQSYIYLGYVNILWINLAAFFMLIIGAFAIFLTYNYEWSSVGYIFGSVIILFGIWLFWYANDVTSEITSKFKYTAGKLAYNKYYLKMSPSEREKDEKTFEPISNNPFTYDPIKEDWWGIDTPNPTDYSYKIKKYKDGTTRLVEKNNIDGTVTDKRITLEVDDQNSLVVNNDFHMLNKFDLRYLINYAENPEKRYRSFKVKNAGGFTNGDIKMLRQMGFVVKENKDVVTTEAVWKRKLPTTWMSEKEKKVLDKEREKNIKGAEKLLKEKLNITNKGKVVIKRK